VAPLGPVPAASEGRRNQTVWMHLGRRGRKTTLFKKSRGRRKGKLHDQQTVFEVDISISTRNQAKRLRRASSEVASPPSVHRSACLQEAEEKEEEEDEEEEEEEEDEEVEEQQPHNTMNYKSEQIQQGKGEEKLNSLGWNDSRSYWESDCCFVEDKLSTQKVVTKGGINGKDEHPHNASWHTSDLSDASHTNDISMWHTAYLSLDNNAETACRDMDPDPLFPWNQQLGFEDSNDFDDLEIENESIAGGCGHQGALLGNDYDNDKDYSQLFTNPYSILEELFNLG